MADDGGSDWVDASAMKTIAISTSCHCCGRRVTNAMHLILCDGCLDRRIAQVEPMPARAAGVAVFAALDRRVAVAA